MKLLSKIFMSMPFFLCILSGCDRDILTDKAVQTASIVLNVPKLKSSDATRVVGSAEENAVNTLRVVILSNAGGSWRFNQLYTNDNLKQGADRILIENVPVGEVQIFVIANEASIGKDYTDIADLYEDVIPVGNSNKLLIKDLNREYFPKWVSEFPEAGLPMGWMDKSLIIAPPSDTPQVINVQLERQVAKLNINMHNALTTDITVTDVSLGAFFTDRFYFFREADLDVPDDAQYTAMAYSGLNIKIEAGTTELWVCYCYPSFAWKDSWVSSPYTIGFKTAAGVEYLPQSFIGDDKILNSIIRNTQINIHASLTAQSNVNIEFSVEDWTEYTADVPDFK